MKNNNSKLIITIVLIVALLVIGVVLYLVFGQKGTEQADKNTQDQSTASSKNSNVDPSKEFKPSELNKIAYVEKSTSGSGEMETTTITESDGKGNIKTVSKSSGITTETYIIGDISYSCIDGKCEKKPISADDKSIDTSFLDKYAPETKTYIGKADCPAGTCDQWEVKNKAGMTMMYYIDKSNRPSKTTFSTEGITGTTEYEYKSVKITAPKV